MKTTARLAALTVAFGAAALAPTAANASCPANDPCTPSGPTKVAKVGTFNGAGAPVAIKAYASDRSNTIRTAATGARALIVCQTTGTKAKGPYGTSRIWDKLKNGGFVSDTRVYTGSDGRVAPNC